MINIHQTSTVGI